MAARLASQPSPYLQQHADNPVDWWPWTEAAFEEAQRRDVPVFLSIGYATCHWCHVMAHESFEDAQVAQAMNDAFVCIKVDREERPDVDEVYMAACQAMTGHGGWPLTVMLDHDKRPWFAGTYFPRESMAQRIGMLDLVPALQQAWQQKREDIHRQAEHLAQHIRSQRPAAGDAPDAAVVERGAAAVAAAYDPRHGGFSRQPKFPSLHIVRFLLRRAMDGDEQARSMAHHTLQAMARGGIRDLVGGGFHRYSTDARWHLPHFEKMLNDQAMALWTYAEAHRLDPQPVYERVIRDTAAYLGRDMRHPSGAFFAAEDADSEGEEGRFYTWPWEELVDLVGEDLARSLGAAPEGNFHEEATGEPVERSILYAAGAEELGSDLVSGWKAQRQRLRGHRARRVRPLRDEKIMADWNGLAIAGLSVASMALHDEGMAALAKQAAEAVLGNMREGRLRHTWIQGELGESSFAEDHAAMACGLLLLYEATWEPRWLDEATGLLQGLEEFAADSGAYHRSPSQELFARPVESYDGAVPSANTLAAEAWLHHARLAASPASDRRAARLLESFGGSLREHPRSLVGMLGVAADAMALWCDIVVEAPAGSGLLATARRLRGPRVHVLRHDPRLAVGFLPPATGGEVAYLCTGDACGPPLKDADALQAAVAAALRR